MGKKIFELFYLLIKNILYKLIFFSIFSMAKGGEGLTSVPPGLSGHGSADKFGTLTDLAK